MLGKGATGSWGAEAKRMHANTAAANAVSSLWIAIFSIPNGRVNLDVLWGTGNYSVVVMGMWFNGIFLPDLVRWSTVLLHEVASVR